MKSNNQVISSIVKSLVVGIVAILILSIAMMIYSVNEISFIVLVIIDAIVCACVQCVSAFFNPQRVIYWIILFSLSVTFNSFCVLTVGSWEDFICLMFSANLCISVLISWIVHSIYRKYNKTWGCYYYNLWTYK